MIYIALIVLGLIFGSFVNAFVWRLHEQAELAEGKGKKSKGKTKKASKLSAQELSMLHGRSMCSRCHHPLAAKDLVPVFSWLWLRGKCRYCGVRIEDNPLIEVVTGLAFPLSYLWWPHHFTAVSVVQFVFWLAFIVGFMVLAAYDLRWFILPDKIVFPLIGLATLEVLIVAVMKHDAWFALDALLGALTLSGVFYVLFQLSGGAWIGGGDVKLGVVLGMLAGSPLQAILVLFFASIIGTICSIPILLTGRKGLKVQVPFGPYLLAATFVVVLFGHQVINWYMSHLIYR